MEARVIVAHDLRSDIAPVRSLLLRHGFESRQVHDGNSLLALASAWRPRAAVIDLELRDMPALEAAGSLRRDFGGGIHLVGFAPAGAAHLERDALNAGFDHVVVDLANSAEILLALPSPVSELVVRGQESSLAFVETLFDYADNRLEAHGFYRDSGNRMRSIALVRRAIETLGRTLEILHADDRARMRVRLASLEAQFRILVDREA